MFCNSADAATVVNISGGTIINRVTIQHPSTSFAANGVLNITGGDFDSTTPTKVNVRLLAFGNDYTNIKTAISGADLNVGIGISDYTDAPIQWIFTTNPVGYHVPDNYQIVDNHDGTWTVSEKPVTPDADPGTESTT
jgi:hypothetical protein